MALTISSPGTISLIPDEYVSVGAGEVLLQLNYVGFCGSDLSTFLGKNPLVKYPVIPGHEISAVIHAVGADVPSHLLPGTPCTVHPYTSCGKCTACQKGKTNACQFNQTLGVQRDGAMRGFIAVPWQKVILAPGLNAQELAMVEPLSVGYHAVSRGQVSEKDTVLIIGLGMIGVGVLFGVLSRGAKAIVVDQDQRKLDQALQWGASEAYLSANVKDVSPDVIIEAVGSPVTYRNAIDWAPFGGRVVYIGYALPEVAFETRWFVQKELDIKGSRNALAEDFEAVVNYLRAGSFDLQPLISKIIQPEDAAQTIQEWIKSPGDIYRILVQWNGRLS
ncbi:Alcohol dehydrogenase GroES domain protein [Leadbetterella byssophila DSM 17132]|uniref:Alcohol dehydrogenase GroES domain protein n=1 Tax=Leadbetterella byssophila (strain DSM 17132 / JCM 16389 / KACC 11308 / NBRC 106382 / 4M15) TaxID=649349 RepID=E4RRG9_LEAB4|nr:zinc-binding alcohol dehydrogenase family protein [Leadbetterella byssophila]ADQ15798.1 Alcohol dehydrogenase GroES domain protein [Leadbetterella byssophila DSM 17132]